MLSVVDFSGLCSVDMATLVVSGLVARVEEGGLVVSGDNKKNIGLVS